MDDEQFKNLISKVLIEEKDKIIPNERLLTEILSAIDVEVTTPADNRFIFRGDKSKGRASINNKNQIYNPMTINWKLTFGVIVLAIIASVSYYQFALKTPQYAQEQEGAQQIATLPKELPKATGDIDVAADALIQDALNEAAVIADEGNDIALLSIDSQAIDDFGQSYNEEF